MREAMERFVIRVTARWWNARISAAIGQLYETGVIDSTQLHVILHEFDPTQAGLVGRIISGGPNVGLTSALLKSARR